jgi:putative flippase GtrA
MHQAAVRFGKYTIIGTSTFALDLLILFLLVDFFSIHQVSAAGLAFIIAVSINYVFSRKFVFSGTLRSIHGGYFNFVLIAGIGLILVIGLMYVLIEIFSINYLVSRILVAIITGFWNYLINLFVNFKVAGKN